MPKQKFTLSFQKYAWNHLSSNLKKILNIGKIYCNLSEIML